MASGRQISVIVLCLTSLMILFGCGGGDGTDASSNGNANHDEATQLAEMVLLVFPFEDSSKATSLGSFGCPDWNGPGSPHPGLDVNTSGNLGYDRVRLVSPAQGTVSRIEFIEQAALDICRGPLFFWDMMNADADWPQTDIAKAMSVKKGTKGARENSKMHAPRCLSVTG